MNAVVEYSVGINPNRIVVRPVWLHRSKYRTASQINNQIHLSNNKTGGQLSQKTKHKLISAINWMTLSTPTTWIMDKTTGKTKPFKIGFFTLTIPSMEIPPTINETNQYLLIPLLKSLRKYFDVRTYIWKVELQKNKMPHYHLTINRYIPYKKLLNLWNRLLNKHGYLDEYKIRHPNKTANSVDCKSVKNINNLGAYLAKYMSKDLKEIEKGNTRKWGLSTNLSKAIMTKASVVPDRIEKVSRGIEKDTSFYAENSGCCVYYCKPSYWQRNPAEELWQAVLRTCDMISGKDGGLFAPVRDVEIVTHAPQPLPCKRLANAQPKLF